MPDPGVEMDRSAVASALTGACTDVDAYCDFLGAAVTQAFGAANYCFMPWKVDAHIDDFRIPGASNALKQEYLRRFYLSDPAYFHLRRLGAETLAPFEMTDLVDHDDLERRPIFAEFMHELGVDRALCIPLTANGRLVANVSMFRGPSQHAFDQRHFMAAKAMTPMLTLAYQLAAERERAGRLEDALAGLASLDGAILVFDGEDKLIFWSSQASPLLGQIGLEPQAGMLIRDDMLRAALRAWRALPLGEDHTFVRAGERGACLNVHGRCAADGRVLARISFGARSVDPADRALCYGLTSRQREVAMLAAHGATNGEIAGELSISERTVENHIAAVLDRTGASRRSQLAALLLWRDEGSDAPL